MRVKTKELGMDAEMLQGASNGELVERAASILPVLKKHAAQGEINRQISDESFRAIADAGLLKLMVPRRYGGHETSARCMLDVTSKIAEADGAAAWVTMIINGIDWIVGLFPDRTRDEVFGANPEATVAGVLTPSSTVRRVEGGFRVSGKWHYNSGSKFATWALVGIPPLEEDGRRILDQSVVLIPASDYMIEDTWYVAGMKATGSNTLVAEDVFVPIHRVMSVEDALNGINPHEHPKEETLFGSSFAPLLSLILAGPQLGMARAALEYVKEKANKKGIAYTVYETQSSSVAFQLQIAEAATRIDTAHLHAYRAADIIDAAAKEGRKLEYLERARCRADAGWAAEQVTAAIDKLLWAHGSGGFAEVNPLQRMWRDSSVAARHAVILPAIGFEVLGKALLGVDDFVTPLV